MARVVVVGAGNIGSHALPHVARMSDVEAVTVIDRDVYHPSNLDAQCIDASDIGKSKAQAQARRLKKIDRALDVRPVHTALEDVPLGWLRSSVILSCLDSRRGRMLLNQASWRLGVPWINAGVDASGLARVQVFMPSADAACLECAWDARDYELIEQDYPCQDEPASLATGASAALGALAAALQALECQKLLARDWTNLLAGRDVLIDARHNRHYVTRFERNASCRMPDHAGWSIARWNAEPSSTTLADLVAMTDTLAGSGRGVRMRVAGQQFVVTLTCQLCHERRPAGRLHRGERRRNPGPCPGCGGTLVATGFDLQESVSMRELPSHLQNRSLTELGMLNGDVVTFTTPEVEEHVELCGTPWPIEF